MMCDGSKDESKMNSMRQSSRHASRPVDVFRSGIQRMSAWSVLTTKWVPSRHGQSCSTAYTTARHSLCVVLYRVFTSHIELDRYPMGFGVLSACSCKNTHLNWVAHASVSMAYCPSFWGSLSTRGVTSPSSIYSPLHVLQGLARIEKPFFSLASRWGELPGRRANLGTKLL